MESVAEVWLSLKKGVFSKKNPSFKSYGVSFTYCDNVNSPYCIFTSTVAYSYTKVANEMLSSTRSRSK